MKGKMCPILALGAIHLEATTPNHVSRFEVENVRFCKTDQCAWWDLGAKKCVIMCLPYLFNLTSIKKGRP